MDFHLKQWRNQEVLQQVFQSEAEAEADHHHQLQYPCAKMPKLHHHDNPSPALPLFLPDEPKITPTITNYLSTTFPRTGSYFSLAQWQELELQALIYRYMLAGAAVPPELLYPIKKSLLFSTTPPYFLNHFQPALLQSGYWGRLAMDPEPGRCRRTDGKKWRCSRDVVAGHKYCERHMHRGRNRSRKPVEVPTPATAAAVGGGNSNRTTTSAPPRAAAAAGGSCHFAFSDPSPSIDLLHLSQSSSHSKQVDTDLFNTRNEVSNRSDGHVLRHFFDDWPRTIQETDGAGAKNSATTLSISMPGNSTSDVSLKLSTGVGNESRSRDGNGEREQSVVNWGSGWSSNHVSSMGGGPLAEALRSSTTSSLSPTSVLHQLPPSSGSDTSYVSTLRN